MEPLLSLLIGTALFAVNLMLCIHLFGQTPADPAIRALIAGRPRHFLDTGPAEPCWTEEIGRDALHVYARSQCPNYSLMELDARARRGDFPVPLSSD